MALIEIDDLPSELNLHLCLGFSVANCSSQPVRKSPFHGLKWIVTTKISALYPWDDRYKSHENLCFLVQWPFSYDFKGLNHRFPMISYGFLRFPTVPIEFSYGFPGTLPASFSARSMSMVPVTRSSVAPRGSSTKGVRLGFGRREELWRSELPSEKTLW